MHRHFHELGGSDAEYPGMMYKTKIREHRNTLQIFSRHIHRAQYTSILACNSIVASLTQPATAFPFFIFFCQRFRLFLFCFCCYFPENSACFVCCLAQQGWIQESVNIPMTALTFIRFRVQSQYITQYANSGNKRLDLVS